jgi:hypothetical protein
MLGLGVTQGDRVLIYMPMVAEAAFAMFAAYYNYCWRTRKPGKSGKKRPTAAMMAKLTDHLWGFDEFFDAVLRPATRS